MTTEQYTNLINTPPVFDDGEPITIDGLLDHAKNLVPLPSVVIKLLDVIDKQDISSDRIARIIERDQAITAAVLRMANSAFYRPMSTITSLQTAVSWVGIRGVRDIAMAASLIKAPAESRELVDILRKHMLATGSCARVICAHVTRINKEIAFLGGLLKDLGRFLITLAIPGSYYQLCELAEASGVSIEDAERAWFGFTQAEVGAHLAKQWQFPQLVVDVIRYQNHTLAQRASLAPEKSWYVSAALLADEIALHIRHGNYLDPSHFENHESQAALRLSGQQYETILEECTAAISEMQSVFDL